ncbi:MAG TPA: peptidyl-prolyl cis-trans isomerase [Solirubrobacteraceae bacterium]|nr:peptidyl-prolyl cis-trans isomerase [Solirubrobacteraceae bacterium]
MPRTALALGAVFFALILAGCGSSVPSSDMAKVDNTTIAKTTFAHWLGISEQSAQQQGGNALVLDPPNFTKCIAAAKAAAPKPAKGQPTPTDATFKKTCQQQYEQQKDQVVSFLLRSQWLEAEAARQGITVSDAELKSAFNKARLQAFPKTADYIKFLKSSGQTEADLLYRERAQLLEQKITAKVTKGAKNVTQQDVQAYYNKNKAKQFTTPEQRSMHVILTKDQATAAKARAAILAGTPWATVAKQYSIDPAAKDNGGVLNNVVKGQGAPDFEKGVFGAKKGVVTAPFKTADGWYVVRVDGIKPAKVTPLNAATSASIKQILLQTKQQAVLTKFGKDYTDRWKSKTDCQKGYVVSDCSNYKAPSTSTTTPGVSVQTNNATPTTATTK